MASGDRYIFTVRGNQDGFPADIDNVFAYEQVSGGSGADGLGEAFETVVGPAIRHILSSTYNMIEYYIVNVDDPVDFVVYPVGVPGDIDGEPLNPFVSWSFEYLRTSRAVNNGRKAFSPISETSIAGGVPTADQLTRLVALAGLLTISITDGGTNEWSPRIWKRPGTYASGVVAAPGLFFAFGNVIYKRVSTQNTRKQ